MNTIETILSRRSIRNFNDKNISKEDINTILSCAMNAPTARNQQGFRFVVVDDKKIFDNISQTLEHGKMCKSANKAVLVCYEIKDETSELYWVQDASAATQNILLSAAYLGIGSVWVAIHPRESKINFIKEQFDLPENIKPLSLIALGYKDDFLKKLDRFDTNKIKYNSWNTNWQ
ncbi:MAG: nitroreductase family protein [Campylobacterota bacterium]|nr:nitroreductase family protein [Campylobacterota bacterium]